MCLSACPQPSFVPPSLPLCAQPVFSSAFEFFSILIQVSPMIFLSVSLSVSQSLCVCLLVSLSARLCVFLPAPNPPSFPLPSLSVLFIFLLVGHFFSSASLFLGVLHLSFSLSSFLSYDCCWCSQLLCCDSDKLPGIRFTVRARAALKRNRFVSKPKTTRKYSRHGLQS